MKTKKIVEHYNLRDRIDWFRRYVVFGIFVIPRGYLKFTEALDYLILGFKILITGKQTLYILVPPKKRKKK